MRSILITGATGYFANGFVRMLLTMPDGPERICLFSRGEFRQAQMRADLKDDSRLRWFVGDCRDTERLRRAMDGVELVVHAAALKRIEVAEYNVMESVATNVIGSSNVVSAAIDAGVEKAILLSSDKAVAATTTYGMTKAIAERIFLQSSHYAGPDGPKFGCVRYGNVWGSTGSVLPTWRAKWLKGVTELPVTDPECTRFFMTLEHACQLVWDTALTMKGGELVIPELPAYRLGDLVAAINGASMKIIGLANGEKLHETMCEGGPDSSEARRMTIDELTEALKHV